MKSKELTNQGAGKRRVFPVKAGTEPRVLWKANLRIGDRKDWFLYRSSEEFELAATTAEQLLQQSTAATMVGAVIIGIERQARLWN
jgi:hypothetical protein